MTLKSAEKSRKFSNPVRGLAMSFLVIFSLLSALIRQFSWPQIESFLQCAPWGCPLKKWIGLKCAFCGMTHSWIAWMRGEGVKSFQENALGPVLWLWVVFALLYLSVGRPISLSRAQKQNGMWGVLVIFLGYAIIRNL